MQDVIQEFTIGFFDSSGVFSIYMKQDDTDRVIKFHIVDNAEDYSEFLSNPYLIMTVREQLPSGDMLPDIPIDRSALDLETMSLTIHVTKEMLQQCGVANCELMFSSSTDGLIITTVPFKLIIEENFVAPPSEETQIEFDNWTELYIEVRALEDEINFREPIRIANENERISQENARQAAEAERERIVGDQVKQAEAWAKGTRDGVPVPSSDETYENNAKYYAINSYDSSVISGSFMRIAGGHSEDSEAYAVGKRNGVDVPSTDATYHNNSKYYRDQAQAIMDELDGTVRAQGTCTFAELPAVEDTRPGDMWNISDEFVTTSDFRDGAGKRVGAGANVYMTISSKWDIFAGSSVTGIKGNAETDYRQGNVNLTHADLGMETKPVANSINPVESNGLYATISEVVPIENSDVSTRGYAVGDPFIYNSKLHRATSNIAIGDTLVDRESMPVVGALSLSYDPEYVTKVNIDGVDYNSYENMPVKANSVVTLYHDASRRWNCYSVTGSYSDLGVGAACTFTVPSDASGDDSLYVGHYDTASDIGDIMRLEYSSGWVKLVTPVSGEGVVAVSNCAAVDNLAKQVGILNKNTTATYQNKDVPFRFGIAANGDYGYYKDGADTVTPFKTDINVVKLGSNGTSYNVTGYKGWQKFTNKNFIVAFTRASAYVNSMSAETSWDSEEDAAKSRAESSSASVSISQGSISYNSSTGVVTINYSRNTYQRVNLTASLSNYSGVVQTAGDFSYLNASIDYDVYLVY